MYIHFLGTGTSVGVPQIGCTCPVCLSPDPRNKRLRSSILVRSGATQLLVDSSPDLRQQALREGFDRLDAVVYTHAHLDHIAGFDDLRAFCWHRHDRLPLYASPDVMEALRSMYGWAFAADNTYKGYVRPDPRVITAPFDIGAIRLTPVPVVHGTASTSGYLFEAGTARVGYACDVKEIPQASMDMWRDLDVLILDGLRYHQHPTHMSVGETIAVMEELKPRRGYITHMSHEIDYEGIIKLLPDGILPAFDGLRLEVRSATGA